MVSGLARLAGFWFAALVWSLPVSAGSTAIVTNQGGDSVSIVELNKAPSGATAAVREVAVGRAPAGVAIDTRSRRAFITNAEGRSVSVVDIATGTVILEREIGAGPVGIAHDPVQGRVYVADWYRNALWVLQGSDLDARGRLAEWHLGD